MLFFWNCVKIQFWKNKMKAQLKLVVKIQRPVCRTPIKPLQKHKVDVQYTRKLKHKKGNHHDWLDKQ